jgi:glycosyltransferase involved in cell wall biosynthesis
LPSTEPPDPSAKLGDIAAAAGLQRIHILAWRDLDDPEAGGSELHIHEVAKRWAAAGIHVTVRTSYAAGRAPEIVRDGYRVIRRAGRYLVFPRAALSERTGRHGPADALVEIWNGMPFLSPAWHRGRRIVLLHHVHGEMFRMVLPPSLARVGELVERRLAPPFYRRTAVATLSSSARDEILRELRLAPELVEVVPPGIDERFRPDATLRAPVPTVVAVGRLVPVKHHDVLIRAAAEARAAVPDLRLRILGEGYEREHIEALIESLGAQDWIELAGRVDDADLLRSYQEAWVVASASSHEGWGMTLTEAAACGTPAVATDIPGHTDAVDHGITGLLTGEDDLGRALVQLLTDHEERQRLGRQAAERAAELTWDATALHLLTLLADQPAHHG